VTAKRTVDLALFTRPQLAKIFQKDARTIARWIDDGLPVAVKGRGGRPSRYNLPDCVRWVLDRELQARSETGTDLSPQLERARLDQRRREELELRIRVRKGELVEVEAVQAEYADLAVVVKARLRAIPDAVADQLTGQSPAAVKALLLTRIDDALRELARGVHIASVDEDDDPEHIDAVVTLEAHA